MLEQMRQIFTIGPVSSTSRADKTTVSNPIRVSSASFNVTPKRVDILSPEPHPDDRQVPALSTRPHTEARPDRGPDKTASVEQLSSHGQGEDQSARCQNLVPASFSPALGCTSPQATSLCDCLHTSSLCSLTVKKSLENQLRFKTWRIHERLSQDAQ